MSFAEVATIIITSALTVATGGFLRFSKKALTQNMDAFKTLQEAERSVIRYQIVQAHDYFVNKGTIGKYSLSSLEDMYEKYVQLGGNSFIHSLMDDIRELEII